jgi:hypothetical protein
MRAVSGASILLMLGCQFVLLRRLLPVVPAALALLNWQLVCNFTNTAHVQYYCAAYFFSQGVGMTFAWAALLLLTWSAPRPWQRACFSVLGAACAGLAYLCHIVPGACVLGGLGLYSLVCWLRTHHLSDLARLALLGAVGLAVVLGTDQLAHMGQARQDTGWVPLKNLSLLLAWIPTLLLGLWWVFSSRGSSKLRRPPVEQMLEMLIGVLVVAGLLQGYCAAEYALGKAASYSVNKLFYVLFPVSTLVWLLAGLHWLQSSGWLDRLRSQRLLTHWPAQVAGTALVGLMLILNGRSFVNNELRDEHVGPEQHPVLLARRLAQKIEPACVPGDPRWRSDLIYFDPALCESSVFVNVVGLRRSWGDAFQVVETLRGQRPEQTSAVPLRDLVHFSRLVMPPTNGDAAP